MLFVSKGGGSTQLTAPADHTTTTTTAVTIAETLNKEHQIMSNSSIQAFITFLRGEAQQAEERSRRLRSAAATIEAQHREGERVFSLEDFLCDSK